MITHVAIIGVDGKVYSLPEPYRHHHVIKVMADVCGLPTPIKGEQGFLNHKGDFMNRKFAARYALQIAQIERLDAPPRLFSEDLW